MTLLIEVGDILYSLYSSVIKMIYIVVAILTNSIYQLKILSMWMIDTEIEHIISIISY